MSASTSRASNFGFGVRVGTGIGVGVVGSGRVLAVAVGLTFVGPAGDDEVLGSGNGLAGGGVLEDGVPDPFDAAGVQAVVRQAATTAPSNQPCQARRVRLRVIHRGYPVAADLLDLVGLARDTDSADPTIPSRSGGLCAAVNN